MSNGSISLLRANVALTTNVKLVVDTKYNLYLESYNSNRELSDKKYKKFLINADCFLSERIAKFYQNLPSDLAYEVKNDIKSDTIQDKYINQYDDIYYSGPRNVEDNRYIEEFQYNTTLKINPNKLPKYFFIFRRNDPGVTEMFETEDDYLRDLKVTQVYDLTPQTNFGKLWKKNYIDDDILSVAPLEINLNTYEFSQWNGYDYKTGGTVAKSFFLDEFMQNQTTDFEFESFLTDGFKKNEVVSSNYSNISFLYDDTVSDIFLNYAQSGIKYYETDYPFIFKLIRAGKIIDTQYTKSSDVNGIYYTFNENVPYRKKWTINRYSGFYVDELVKVGKVSSYTPVPFKNDNLIFIQNNKFVKEDEFNNMVSVSPVDNYTENTPVHFKINEDLYLVEKVPVLDINENIIGYDYVLISDTVFNGNMLEYITNSQKAIKIEYTNPDGIFKNYIKNIDGTYYYNNSFEKYIDGICIIKIFNDYYTLIIDEVNSKIYINTDELISCDSNLLSRKLGENDIRYDNLQILTKDNLIEYFNIYFIQFTDVNDWCFNRTQTNSAKIEYSYRDKVDYNRPFFYAKDIKDTSVPKDYFYETGYSVNLYNSMFETYTNIFNNKFILPLISEYAASGDLYMLTIDNKLTRIWDINQSVNKFGLSKSINTNAVEYKLNNSLDVWGSYNFTPNLYAPHISISDLNLDWFYTFGKPFNYSLDDYAIGGAAQLETNIINRTLNVDLQRIKLASNNPLLNQQINQFYKPDFNYYKDPNAVIDYFDYLFNVPYTPDVIANFVRERSLNRIAYLLPSDNVNGPSFFFKGINAYVQYVQLDNPNEIDTYTTTPANDLVDYGFAIAFNAKYTTDDTLHGKAGIDIVLNKVYKNILVNIYIYTPFESLTSLDYRNRSRIYNENIIRYGVYDSFTGLWSWKDSELSTQALTLNRFISIVSNNKLVDANFSAGIKYEIIDKNEKIFRTDSITIDPTDNNIVVVKFTEDPFFKEGQWIKFNGTGLQQFDANIQVSSKVNNFVYKFKFNENMTSPIGLLNTLDDITITKEKSVLPFKFKMIYPNEIKINTNINIVLADTSCPVLPVNSNITVHEVNLDQFTNNGIVPHVYCGDAISRKIFKAKPNNALTYNEIQKFPSIFRFSGYYEPMLNEIELFNKSSLNVYNVIFNDINDTIINYMTYVSLDQNLTYNIVFDIQNSGFSGKAEIGDIIHFNSAPDFDFLNFKTAHIIDIKPAIDANHIRIVCSINLETVPAILAGSDEITPYSLLLNGNTCNAYFFKVIDKNMTFNYNYEYFGLNKNIIISKVYDTINILKTNNSLNNMTNRFPMIDEHGVTTIDRNIFKSSWDKDYYYKTISNKTKLI